MFHKMWKKSLDEWMNMYVNICQIAPVVTTCDGTSQKLRTKSRRSCVGRKKVITNTEIFVISSHFNPVGKRLEEA